MTVCRYHLQTHSASQCNEACAMRGVFPDYPGDNVMDDYKLLHTFYGRMNFLRFFEDEEITEAGRLVVARSLLLLANLWIAHPYDGPRGVYDAMQSRVNAYVEAGINVDEPRELIFKPEILPAPAPFDVNGILKGERCWFHAAIRKSCNQCVLRDVFPQNSSRVAFLKIYERFKSNCIPRFFSMAKTVGQRSRIAQSLLWEARHWSRDNKNSGGPLTEFLILERRLAVGKHNSDLMLLQIVPGPYQVHAAVNVEHGPGSADEEKEKQMKQLQALQGRDEVKSDVKGPLAHGQLQALQAQNEVKPKGPVAKEEKKPKVKGPGPVAKEEKPSKVKGPGPVAKEEKPSKVKGPKEEKKHEVLGPVAKEEKKPKVKGPDVAHGLQMTVSDALVLALDEEMADDPKIILICEKLSKISKGLLDKYGPDRVRDSPITKAGFGVGGPYHGLKPVIEFMTLNFLMQAIDNITNCAEKLNYMSAGQISIPIVFRGPNGGASGLGAQHFHCYAALFGACPGLKVLAPYSSEDARGLLKAAIRDPYPVVVLENKLLYGESFPVSAGVLSSSFCLPVGKAKIEREGNDVTITAFSRMVGYALQAADLLAEEGIRAEVINLRSICPIDRALINDSVMKTNRLVTVEEGSLLFGVGAEICACILEKNHLYVDARVERIAGGVADAANPERETVLQVQDIVSAAKRAYERLC